MRAHNETVAELERRAGFYGLDIYNMSGSIAAVLEYLDKVDPEAAAIARERYGCLTPWQKRAGDLRPRGAHRRLPQMRAGGRSQQCRELLQQRLDYAGEDGESFLDAAQNARLVASAERYYRIMYYGGAESWNLRDTHMFETLEHLLEARGPGVEGGGLGAQLAYRRCALHRHGRGRDELNIGQLCRERFGDEAALIGFGTHTGTVAAATDWDGDMEVKRVRPSHRDSYERLCHDAGRPALPARSRDGPARALRRRLLEPRLERFIGVIYRPETELMSHYAEASLPQQHRSERAHCEGVDPADEARPRDTVTGPVTSVGARPSHRRT